MTAPAHPRVAVADEDDRRIRAVTSVRAKAGSRPVDAVPRRSSRLVERPAACAVRTVPVQRAPSAHGTPVRDGGVWPDGLRRSRPVHLVLVVLVTLLVVGALGWLGRTAGVGVPAQAPAEVTVVRVGTGETVWDVARRVAPESDPRVVVQRIRELNDMPGSAVQPGWQLRVPDGR